ncbi:hypothetical protein PG994_002636 [Apiospora phragmitis]|uniref:Uncharacterized protein n=1 Tax=Apiospora phragmitis TaxID=2905665 RepID=A0ABR1W9H1_9PEZI
MRQKLVLTGVFLLVGFTIAVTVVRGSIFGGVYKAVGNANHIRVLNIGWLLFWFMIQYVVSFMIACIISFRSLWVNKREKTSVKRFQLEKRWRAAAAEERSPADSGQRRGQWSRMQDSVLQTMADLEAADLETDSDQTLEHQPPSEIMLVDMSNGGRGDNDWSTTGTRRGSSSRRATLNGSHSRNTTPDNMSL